MTQPTVDCPAARPPAGRPAGQAPVERILAGARAGVGAALVLRGGLGIGRTALLEYAVGQAADMRVVRLAGIESELGFGFAALHRLLSPFLADPHRLPLPQRDALRAAFGLVAADPPDRFLVGLAALTLLAGPADGQPLLLAVDDAHWLDQPTTEVLGFVARRLAALPIAFVATVREPTARCPSLDGLPAQYLSALPDPYSRQLADRPGPAGVPPSRLLMNGAEPTATARGALLDALFTALLAGGSAHAATLRSVVQAARARPVPEGATPTAADLLLDGFAIRLAEGYPAAAPVLRRAVAALLTEPVGPQPGAAVPVLGYWAAGELMDAEARRTLIDRWVDTAAPSGEQVDLRWILGLRPDLSALAGAGAESATRAAIAEHLRRAGEFGAGAGAATGRYVLAGLELGLGRYDAALSVAHAVYGEDSPDTGTRVLPDLVEAAVRAGDRGAARSAAERLAERARASGTPLAGGLLARSEALLATGAEAERGYQDAIDQLRRAAEPIQLARAHLLYGEWLRRLRRRRDAREQLRTALDLFGAHDHAGFTARVRTELLATGERGTRHTGKVGDRLTPQEMQVARLVTEGSSNRQVATRLFISPNTVEYHLQKVFRKVGVTSRTQLAHTLLRND